jgi:hypothetical protein
MNKWVFVDDWEKGMYDLPPADKTLQTNLRTRRRIKYSKIGNRVVYLKEWIEEYINQNVVEPIEQKRA